MRSYTLSAVRLGAACFASVFALVGCGSSSDPAPVVTYVETPLTLELAFNLVSPPTPDGGIADGGTGADAGGADAGGADADVDAADAGGVDAAAGVDAALSADAGSTDAAIITALVAGDGGDGGSAGAQAKLVITARDGTTAVITDLWLYTLDASGQMTPLTGFTSTASRKSPKLMLPAMIGGKASGLTPADDGRANGLMTGTTRGTLKDGVFVPAATQSVTVTLSSVPTSPILVVAGVEDQRYAGAAVINPDGTAGTPPAGIGAPEMHTRRSFARDVAPILKSNCILCHNPAGPDDANLYLVTGSRDEIVNDNFALKEDTEDCQTDNPGGGAALAACIQKITKTEYLVEPGAPAISDLLTRSRPDEGGGTSPEGLIWYGGGTPKARYNTTYGDRRMPATTQSTKAADWDNKPIYFDLHPGDFQILYDWVAQGALATP